MLILHGRNLLDIASGFSNMFLVLSKKIDSIYREIIQLVHKVNYYRARALHLYSNIGLCLLHTKIVEGASCVFYQFLRKPVKLCYVFVNHLVSLDEIVMA